MLRRIRIGRIMRLFMRPSVFTLTGFPILWGTSWFERKPDVYLWEKIRPLDPLPLGYRERYANVQAAIGLEALKLLDEWTERTRRHAQRVTEALRRIPWLEPPIVPPDRTHAFYQYCAYFPDRDRTVVGSLKRGVDLETLHVDICTSLELFKPYAAPMPGAEATEQAVQIPVYESLNPAEVARVAEVVRAAAWPNTPARAATAVSHHL